jgi:hypothetical protein
MFGLELDNIVFYGQRECQGMVRTDTTVQSSSLLIEDWLVLSVEMQK